jgi:hypothetical protein
MADIVIHPRAFAPVLIHSRRRKRPCAAEVFATQQLRALADAGRPPVSLVMIARDSAGGTQSVAHGAIANAAPDIAVALFGLLLSALLHQQSGEGASP